MAAMTTAFVPASTLRVAPAARNHVEAPNNGATGDHEFRSMTAAPMLLAAFGAARRSHARARPRAPGAPSVSVVSLRAAATELLAEGVVDAEERAKKINFNRLGWYDQQELEAVYIEAVWYYYCDPKKEILTPEEYDKLAAHLDKKKSSLRKLTQDEVRFIEASIAYYRGKPIMSDDNYKELRSKVSRSGRRKDMTSLIMAERSKRFLNDEEMKKFEEAFYNAREYDFKNLDSYVLADLEELYIDSLWCFYREKRALLSDEEFDTLKKVLYQKGSRFPTLKRFEVAFVEASIAWYRGEPLMSEEEFQELKAKVKASGKRKDVTAFLLYERGGQFLDQEQYAAMKEEYDRLGISAVNLEQCTVAQMEEMYVEALWAYYNDGKQLLSDAQFKTLKEELTWQGSGFPALRRNEIEFVKATLAYHRGEPLYTDEKWEELKAQIESEGMRPEVTAFLLYSKGQEVLDAETFDKMQQEMAKLGVTVQKAGSSFLEQTHGPRSSHKKLPVDPSSLTLEQKQKLLEFRQFLDAQHQDVPDYDLLRFLRARKWDIPAAVMQFQDTCAWRLEHDIDQMRRNAPGPEGLFSCKDLDQDTASKLYCDGVERFPHLRLVDSREDEGAWLFFGMAVAFGVDKQGRPIHLQKSGLASHRFAQMYSFAGQNPCHKIINDGYVRMQEIQAARMQESSERLGKRVTQQVVIMDMKGLSFWPDPRAIAVFKDFLMVSQKYYPETLAIQFFLNTPPIFMAIWRLIKDWIDPVTANKMHLLGSEFQSELLEYIHPDQLPIEYGGTNSFDVFAWPQTLDDYRRCYETCARAADKLPGRKTSLPQGDSVERSLSSMCKEKKENQGSQTLWTMALLLSALLTMVAALMAPSGFM